MASLVDFEDSLVSPESKKQKVDQVSDDDDILVEVQDDGEQGDGYIYDAPLSDFGGDEKLRSQWLLRCQQLKDSDGFDVGPYDGTLIGGCYPMDLDKYDDDSLYLKSLNKCALHAVDEWNNERKGEELKLSRILKAVYASSCGHMFHITLEAEDVSTGLKKVYETKVFDNFIYEEMEVDLFRAKKV